MVRWWDNFGRNKGFVTVTQRYLNRNWANTHVVDDLEFGMDRCKCCTYWVLVPLLPVLVTTGSDYHSRKAVCRVQGSSMNVLWYHMNYELQRAPLQYSM